jgi:hypothetical protein
MRSPWVVEELEEHDPGEHGQPVQVAVESLVLPHDVAGGLDEAPEPLGGREGEGILRFLCHQGRFTPKNRILQPARKSDTES